MSVLLMRFAGPMQSWGTQSRFTERDTGLEPSKSGVIGLVCAAMGIRRDDTNRIRQLASLEMGVRVDREGKVERDFHTVGGGSWPGLDNYGVAKANGQSRQPVVSNRYYLADADFLVALAGPVELLKEIDRALRNPVWPIYLGRKSFVPGQPVWVPDGLKEDKSMETTPERVLRSYPWRRDRAASAGQRLRLVLEATPDTGQRRLDSPISFESRNRRFAVRWVRIDWVSVDELPSAEEEPECTCQD